MEPSSSSSAQPRPVYSHEREQMLTEFAQRPDKDGALSDELLQVVKDLALIGLPCYPWDHLKVLLSCLLEKRVTDMNNAFPGCDSFEQRKTQLVSSLNSFLGPPFTLQRLCELLVEEKPYTNTTKYMNALEKMFAVSGTMPTLSPAEYNQAIEQQHAAFQAALSIPTPGQPQNSNSGINEEQFQIAAVMPDTNATSTETTDATAESPSPSSSSSLSASSPSSSSDSSSLHSNASISSTTTTSDEVGEPEPMDL